MSKTLFIFVDESGNFDFSQNGTKYFVLSAITTLNPLGKERLEKIKYEFIEQGLGIEYFHASEDRQMVRNKVFEFIGNLPDIEIDSVIVQKNKTYSSIYEEKKGEKVKHKGDRLYEQALRTLLQYIFRRYQSEEEIRQVIVVLSSIFTQSKEELISKTIKFYLKQNFFKPFHIYFCDSKSDKNSQVSDYCCWAIYKKWEDGELRPHDVIKSKIKSEFDIFKEGDVIFYEYKK